MLFAPSLAGEENKASGFIGVVIVAAPVPCNWDEVIDDVFVLCGMMTDDSGMGG
jgi:hypothetical protein